MAQSERKVISVHPRDVRQWDYGKAGKGSTKEEREKAFQNEAACHHPTHDREYFAAELPGGLKVYRVKNPTDR